MMEPIGLDYKRSKGYIVIHRCMTCGTVSQNKPALDDPEQPDDIDLVLELMQFGAPNLWLIP